MGGTDDPSNIIELTVEEHAEAHRLLYEKYGYLEDRLAWQGLAGIITKEELVKQLCLEGSKRGARMSNLKRWGTDPSLPPKNPRSRIRKKGHRGTRETKWYHNPETNERVCLFSHEMPPEGWKRGQGKKNRISCYWYTNEIEEGQFEIDKQPESWRRGRPKR
jgi:hypothetical protein